MKFIISTLLACSLALSVSAATPPLADGYYRVQNANSGRYIYIMDNTGYLNFQATTAELGALELWMGYERTIADPATVVYVKLTNSNGREFDLQSQGTGVYSIINYPVNIYKQGDVFLIYGSNSGVARYIGDGATNLNLEQGAISSTGTGKTCQWYFHAMTTADDNYFGVQPEYQGADGYYTTLYADFPFTFAAEGSKAYVVTRCGSGMVGIKEVEGVVPAGTPVIIRATSNNMSNNRLVLGGTAAPIDENMLSGVYFHNTTVKHRNVTANDPGTMRVLGICDDGSLGFVPYNGDNLPRNRAYLVVPEGTPEQLKLVSEEVFDATGIENVIAGAAPSYTLDGLALTFCGNGQARVYGVDGHLVGSVESNASVALPHAGVYILSTSEGSVKIMAH